MKIPKPAALILSALLAACLLALAACPQPYDDDDEKITDTPVTPPPTPPPTPGAVVSSVRISPRNDTVFPNSIRDFTATVEGTGGFDPTVEWSTSQSFATFTPSGRLTIPAGVTYQGPLNIYAKSNGDNTKTDTVTITVLPFRTVGVDFPLELEFDAVEGTTTPWPTRTITVRNPFTAPTEALTVASSAPASEFGVSVTSLPSIGVNGTADIIVSPVNTLTAAGSSAGYPPGKYKTRITVTDTATSGAIINRYCDVTFTVKPKIYGIELTQTNGTALPTQLPPYVYNFGTMLENYSSPPAALTVRVANPTTSNQTTGALTVALSGTDAGSFDLSATSLTSIAVGGMSSFTIQPKASSVLTTAKVYKATITVSNANITASFDVSFTVSAGTPNIKMTSPTVSGELVPSYNHDFTPTPASQFVTGTGYPNPYTQPYTVPAGMNLAVTVQNTGDLATGPLTVTVTPTTDFTINGLSSPQTVPSIPLAGIVTSLFTIEPKQGMAAGTHNATVEVSGTGITNKTFSVSFVVRNKTDAEITLAGIETLVETTIGGSPNVLSLSLNPTFVSLEEQVKFLFTKLKLTETYEIDLSGSTGLSNWKGYNGNIARIVKLTLPNSVTTIDTAAFSTYQSPKEVIGNYVRWIGDSVFYGSSILEKVSFPYVETIGTEAFSYCINLDTADFSSANSIGNLAFRNCIALTSLKLKQSSSSPTMLGSDVFAGTNSAAGNLKINVGTANIAAYQSSWGNIPVITTEFTNTAKFGTAHRSIELTN